MQISPKSFKQLFSTKVFCPAFCSLSLQFKFVILCQKEISAKAARQMLVKLTPARQTGFRTFLRISFDVKEFDRLGNTLNPLFDYKWEMTPREVQSGLIRYSPVTVTQLKVIEDSEKGIFN